MSVEDDAVALMLITGYPHYSQVDLRPTYGREANGENMAGHRRNLHDPGSCEVPSGGTITLDEWRSQQ